MDFTHQWGMAFVMTMLIMMLATMMGVIVVEQMLTNNFAQSAHAITKRLVQLELVMNGLAMDIAMMKPTMLTVTMMT